MNVVTRGIRNAFRNVIRTVSIVVILGLSIGLALSMLVAHQAVNSKIKSVDSNIGNTVTITPAGFSGFSSVNNSLTTAELAKVSTLPDVTNVTELLTDRLTTIGSTAPSFGGFGGGGQSSNTSSSNDQTSLTSPITITPKAGQHIFVNGGEATNLPTTFSLPITIIGTNNVSSVNGTTITLSSGSNINTGSSSDNALISTSMASKNNLKVGSTFTAYGTTLTVTGIFNGSNTSAIGADIIVPLATEQTLSGQSGDVTSAVATVNSLSNLSSATTAIQNSLGSSTADVTSSVQAANETVQPLQNIQDISLYSLIGAVVAGAVIILLVMIMIVRERRREIGVVKAIGASNAKIIVQFMTEAVTLTMLGAVIGIILGVLAGSPITKLLVNNSTSSTSSASHASGGGGGFRGGSIATSGGGTTTFHAGRGALGFVHNNLTSIQAAVGWSIILYGLGAALIIAIVGSGLASFFISKIRPAEVMRVE